MTSVDSASYVVTERVAVIIIQRGGLHPLPHVGDHAVAKHHQVEMVEHDAGIGQGEADPSGIRALRI